ncbi:MAG: endolytic transglycosylase MltG [Anaerolineae bacterium]|nr:endolytic transglycosylase MltG [Anaerolineae bacterium]
MRSLFSCLHAIIHTIFLFLGAVVVVLIAAGLFAYTMINDSSHLVIENGPLWRRLPIDSEALSLYHELNAQAETINTPISNDPSLVSFTIEPGETAETIATRLKEMGLLGDADLFRQLLRYNGIDTRLQAGSFQLRRNMTMRQLGAALYRGGFTQNTVSIPPGWRLEEIATHLHRSGIMDGNYFLSVARQGVVVDNPVLADRPTGQSYEGYLAPGTYHLPDDATPEELIALMLDNFSRQLPANAFDLAHQRDLSFHEVLTIASIIERETFLDNERPLVASVYLNRLNPEFGLNHLQADPTVQYAMGYQSDTGVWWKSPVSLDEYPKVNSPYNTYLYPGLPPGPIASPSLESITAVLYPAETNYLYFVCQFPNCEGGSHVFAATYEDHLQNVNAYWGQ